MEKEQQQQQQDQAMEEMLHRLSSPPKNPSPAKRLRVWHDSNSPLKNHGNSPQRGMPPQNLDHKPPLRGNPLGDLTNSPRRKRPILVSSFPSDLQNRSNPPQLGRPLDDLNYSTFQLGAGPSWDTPSRGRHPGDTHSPQRGPSTSKSSPGPSVPVTAVVSTLLPQFNFAGLPPPAIQTSDKKKLSFGINRILEASFGTKCSGAGVVVARRGLDFPPPTARVSGAVVATGLLTGQGHLPPPVDLSMTPSQLAAPTEPLDLTIRRRLSPQTKKSGEVARATTAAQKPQSNTPKDGQKRRHASQAFMSAADARERIRVVTDYSNSSLARKGARDNLTATKEVVAILARAEAEGIQVCLLNEGYAIRDPWWVDPAAQVETRREKQEDGSVKVSFAFNNKDLSSNDRRGANRKVRREKPNSPYLCIYCSSKYGDATDLTRHTRTHTCVHPFTCPVEGCTKTGKQLIIIEQHMQKEHRIAPPTHRPKSYICEFTGETFLDSEAFLGHSCPVSHLNMERKAKDRRIIKSVPKGEPSRP